MVKLCEHKAQKDLDEASPVGYTHRKATQRPTKDQWA